MKKFYNSGQGFKSKLNIVMNPYLMSVSKIKPIWILEIAVFKFFRFSSLWWNYAELYRFVGNDKNRFFGLFRCRILEEYHSYRLAGEHSLYVIWIVLQIARILCIIFKNCKIFFKKSRFNVIKSKDKTEFTHHSLA